MDTKDLTMPTKYDPQTVEKGRYDWWLAGKFFEAKDDADKQPYTVVIPPPNVTGKLHLGHAWDTTLQDIITRMKTDAGLRCSLASGNGSCWNCNAGKSRSKAPQ